MGLLVVAGIVALVLTVLTLLTVALVQLVLFISVRNAALALVALGAYWLVDSRRRQVAKGFYSCTEVPSAAADELARPARRQPTPAKFVPSSDSTTKRAAATSALMAMTAQEEEEKTETKELTQSTTQAAAFRVVAGSTTESEVTIPADDASQVEERHSLTSNHSEAESCGDEAPVMAAPAFATARPSQLPTPLTTMRLPDLRHRKWKHPTRSLPLAPKGEALLHENRKQSGRSRSASNSPRRPELFGSPRSVAMEQKLMKSALESDGYWIGDFRAPPPAMPKRSASMGGASTPTKPTPTPAAPPATATASSSAAPSSKAKASLRRTGSRAE